MSEYASQPEQIADPDDLFRHYRSIAFGAAAEIRARLHAAQITHGQRTLQDVEKMAWVAQELQRMADFLGA